MHLPDRASVKPIRLGRDDAGAYPGAMGNPRSTTALWVSSLVVGVLAVSAGLWWMWPRHAEPAGPSAAPTARASTTPAASPDAARLAPVTTLAGRPACASATKPFVPTSISIPGITGGSTVITPPRDAQGVPGVPPVTTAGKWIFAMDLAQGIEPGDKHGNVLVNAHTWPDGSALGNAMLAGLHLGDRVVVRSGTSRLCYRVTERVQVLAADGMPRYYDQGGPPHLAILACSGIRLGPGDWDHRTVWFASPSL